jgi:hypothetical protein
MMIAADTIHRIIQFQGDGLPVVSLYVSVGLGASQREIHSYRRGRLNQSRQSRHGTQGPHAGCDVAVPARG